MGRPALTYLCAKVALSTTSKNLEGEIKCRQARGIASTPCQVSQATAAQIKAAIGSITTEAEAPSLHVNEAAHHCQDM